LRLIDTPPVRLRKYLHTLASEAEIDCTIMWSDEELAELQTSLARERARKLRRWADSQWQSLFADKAVAWQQLEPPLNASAERFRWALCAVWSRSFHLRCSEPTCGGAAGTSGGAWRVFAPGADLFNHGFRRGRATDSANAVLIESEGGVDPAEWVSELGGEMGGEHDETEAHVTGAGHPPSGRARARARARAEARSSGSDTSAVPEVSNEAQRARTRPPSSRLRRNRAKAAASPRHEAPLADGLADVALGSGGGVWLWREMEEGGHTQAGGRDTGRSSWLGAGRVGGGMDANWMQHICMHATCLAEPDADSEAWDAVSAAPAHVRARSAREAPAVVLRASREIDEGEEILLDYGARSNAELLTTHGFALLANPADSIPIDLAPRDELALLKVRSLQPSRTPQPSRTLHPLPHLQPCGPSSLAARQSLYTL
jgi:hypothetical protein